MIEYPVGTSGQVLIFAEYVVLHFMKYRQRYWFQREAGGQLFATFDGDRILVNDVTGPHRSDRRTRNSYIPDPKIEQAEIHERFSRGLHYVGDWHTHPELTPSLSVTDKTSIRECVCRSKHELNGFVHVVVGQAKPPDGLSVTLHDGTRSYPLANRCR